MVQVRTEDAESFSVCFTKGERAWPGERNTRGFAGEKSTLHPEGMLAAQTHTHTHRARKKCIISVPTRGPNGKDRVKI